MDQDHNQKSHLSIDNLVAEVELITQAPRPIIFASICLYYRQLFKECLIYRLIQNW